MELPETVGQLTEDQWAPYNDSLTYASDGLVTGVNLGGGSSWQIAAAAGQGLPTSPAVSAAAICS